MAHDGAGDRPDPVVRRRQSGQRRRTRFALRTPEFEVVVDGRLAADSAFRVVRCRSAPIRSEPPCGVELDGQLFGTTPVSVTVQPGALRALDCHESAE